MGISFGGASTFDFGTTDIFQVAYNAETNYWGYKVVSVNISVSGDIDLKVQTDDNFDVTRNTFLGLSYTFPPYSHNYNEVIPDAVGSIQLMVRFKPKELGGISGQLIISYDNNLGDSGQIIGTLQGVSTQKVFSNLPYNNNIKEIAKSLIINEFK